MKEIELTVEDTRNQKTWRMTIHSGCSGREQAERGRIQYGFSHIYTILYYIDITTLTLHTL